MLTVKQLDTLAGHVSPAAGPMWVGSGEQVAYLGSPGGQLDYWKVALEGGEPERITGNLRAVVMDHVGEARVSPDGQWLAYVAGGAGKGSGPEIWLCPLTDRGEPRQLTHLGAAISSFCWSPDSGQLAVSSNRYGSYDIYLVSAETGKARRLTSHPLFEVRPSFSADGTRVLFVRLNDEWTDHNIYSVNLQGEDQRLIVEDRDFFDYKYGGAFGYPLVNPLGNWVLYPSYQSGWINYWRVSVDGGTPEPIAAASADQTEASWSPDGKAVAYVENHRGNLQLRVLDMASGRVSVLEGDGHGSCSHPAWSPGGGHLAYIYQELALPAQLRVIDVIRKEDGYHQVTSRRILAQPLEKEWSQELVSPERVCYPTFDGREIDAFLYRPPAFYGSGPHPAIVLVHGGPTSQFFETFEHQGTFTSAQFFAQKGYVVLLPNVRGSSGYGREFEDLNNMDWGHGDLEDVAWGARYLKGLPEVKGSSLGIYGSSYGASMVMSAVAFRPRLFQAGVSRSGYGDWLYSYGEMDLHHVKMMHYELGPMPENAHIYRRSSPYYHINQITTPTMIIHGEGRPPYSADGRRFAEEMKRLMKPVRHMVYQDEGYYVRSLQGRQKVLEDVGDYFDEYLKDPGVF